MKVFNRELKVGTIILIISISLIIFVEYRAIMAARPMEVNISKDQAEEKVYTKFGEDADVTFERELEKKYYFKVYDKKKKRWIDVYVDKSSTKLVIYAG